MAKESDTESNTKGRFKYVLYQICGLSEGHENSHSEGETNRLQIMKFMDVNPVVRNLLNAKVALRILVIVFMFGYFH